MDRHFHFYEPSQGHGLKHNPFNAIIAPRPIGWISTQDKAGNLNLAPYSFFNAFNYDPPLIGFSSILWKDTVCNAADTGEFAWNLVSKELRERMSATSATLARGEDEFAYSGLTPAPSRMIAVPRVAESRASMECKVTDIVRFRNLQGDHIDSWLVIGEVVGVHIDQSLIVDGVYQTAQAEPVMRGGGLEDYFQVGPSCLFKMARPTQS